LNRIEWPRGVMGLPGEALASSEGRSASREFDESRTRGRSVGTWRPPNDRLTGAARSLVRLPTLIRSLERAWLVIIQDLYQMILDVLDVVDYEVLERNGIVR
jgi:hypothetical protein